jgi:succinate dehydrogenase / fumarate reductase cytochrome b subunit
MTAATGTRAVDSGFLRGRAGSLLAVLPLGIWTLNHLWNNLSAFRGAEAWQADVTEYPHPVAFFASSLIALLPLGLHSVWGIGRLFATRPNVLRYGYLSNWRYLLQRISAVGLLLFLGAHLWLAMLRPRLTTGRAEPFADIAHEMHHHLPTLLVYVLGVAGIAGHLANGLHTFMMGWGVVTSRRALRKLDVLTVVALVAFLTMGWAAIYALWDAGRSISP